MPIAEERDRETRSSRSSESNNNTDTAIKNVATYQMPGILASHRGRPVRLLATGDMPGHSAVCQFVDEDGRIGWDSQDRFVVVDSSYLPPSRETLTEVFRSLSR